jgi:hypothetical protein
MVQPCEAANEATAEFHDSPYSIVSPALCVCRCSVLTSQKFHTQVASSWQSVISGQTVLQVSARLMAYEEH